MTQQPFLRLFVTPAALCAFAFSVAMIAVLQYSLRAFIPGSLEAGGFTTPFCCYGNDVDCNRCGAWVVFDLAARAEHDRMVAS